MAPLPRRLVCDGVRRLDDAQQLPSSSRRARGRPTFCWWTRGLNLSRNKCHSVSHHCGKVKQEVNSTVILPPLVFPALSISYLKHLICVYAFCHHFQSLVLAVAEDGLLNKSLPLTPALGDLKFIAIIGVNLITFCCSALSLTYMFNKPISGFELLSLGSLVCCSAALALDLIPFLIWHSISLYILLN